MTLLGFLQGKMGFVLLPRAIPCFVSMVFLFISAPAARKKNIQWRWGLISRFRFLLDEGNSGVLLLSMMLTVNRRFFDRPSLHSWHIYWSLSQCIGFGTKRLGERSFCGMVPAWARLQGFAEKPMMETIFVNMCQGLSSGRDAEFFFNAFSALIKQFFLLWPIGVILHINICSFIRSGNIWLLTRSQASFYCCFGLFLSFCFLEPHPRHMDVPRLGVESELQLMSQPQQCQIRAASMTCTTAHGNARSFTHWARPGIKLIPHAY